MALRNLNLASNTQILRSLSNLKGSFNPNNAWLTRNRYLVDTISTVQNDIRAGTIVDQELTDYIATSVYIHCFNGWSYLSTAVNSYLEGDFSNAIHNAYYAELRGIMSFLGSQGISAFNGTNVIINASGVISETSSSSTHSFIKTAFDEWLQNPSNKEEILKIITVENKTLKEWVDATGFPPSSFMPSQLASNWLENWSIDLNVIKGESLFRNFVSYNPQTYKMNLGRHSENIENRLKFIADLWKLCAPSELFSNSILRNTLSDLYQQLFAMDVTQFELESDWKSRLIELGMDPYNTRSDYLVKFFRREIEPVDNLVFAHAKNVVPSSPILEVDTDPIGIISRACLLLLINTKAIESILRQTSTSKTDLKFWFDNIGIKLGYWDAASEPYLYSDLWNDVESEISEVNRWLADPSLIHSPYTFKKSFGGHYSNLLHLNKSYLWNLGK